MNQQTDSSKQRNDNNMENSKKHEKNKDTHNADTGPRGSTPHTGPHEHTTDKSAHTQTAPRENPAPTGPHEHTTPTNTTHNADKQHHKKKIEELKTQLNEMTEIAKRTMADMQNLKRRLEEEQKQIISKANASLIESLLPALDNLDRAIKHAPKEKNEWLDGIEMAIKQIQNTLENTGLKTIITKGEQFDPDLHEAVMEEKGEKNMIIEEYEKGYTLGNKVLRHAKVSVGNGKK